jgi:hypothetical protein
VGDSTPKEKGGALLRPSEVTMSHLLSDTIKTASKLWTRTAMRTSDKNECLPRRLPTMKDMKYVDQVSTR